MRTQSITLKLTPTEYLAIETIMESGKYESRSAMLRAGLGSIFDQHKLDKSFDLAIEQERSVHKPRPSTAKRYFAKDIAKPNVHMDEPYSKAEWQALKAKMHKESEKRKKGK